MSWPHGPKELNKFPNHLNNIHPNIQFTVEMWSNDHLPFMDIDMYRRPDGSLRYAVYRKTTNTNLYLNAVSHHHHPLSNKHPVLSTLVH